MAVLPIVFVGLASFAGGAGAQVIMPGPENATSIPPWAWAIAFGGAAGLAILSTRALVATLQATFAKLEADVATVKESVHDLPRFGGQIERLDERVTALENRARR